ncbi:MAG: sigma-70 family RNA polymerase sigma factor [Chloroflexi bacterium]|nr:sigma-70 family RNA polymerase sigma factor [Chloroflexota bacterium]
MRQDEICRLSIDQLAKLCAEQTRLFETGRTSDGRYCYELIRRAVLGISGAWEAMDAQYRPWLCRKIANRYQDAPDDIKDLVQESLIRFHRYVTPDRWEKFPDLAHLLAYLGKCARSQILNHHRNITQQHKREQAFSEGERLPRSCITMAGNPEHRVVTRESECEYYQWQERVRECVSRKCRNPHDWRLIELRWVYDLPPREIHARYPDEFPSLPELYKLIRNLKDRISRDSECAALLSTMPQNNVELGL